MQKKKNLFIGFILIGLLFVVGTSLAFWQITLTQEEENVLSSECFKVDFVDKNDITINNAYPMTDLEGSTLTPYQFTITNVCNTNATYQVNLEKLIEEGKRLSSEYVKVALDQHNGKLLHTFSETEKTLDDAYVSYKLTTGVLKPKESVSYELRLWLDEETPVIDEVMNASFLSKVVVIATYKEIIPDVTTLASEYLDGIKIQNIVSNIGNENLTYFYQLDDGEEIVSSDANYTFTGLNDGTYHVCIRIENQDGIIIQEESQDVVIAYEHVYVSSSGNDTTGIGSMDNPYATLQRAYNKVKDGGEVILLSDLMATSTSYMSVTKAVFLRSNGDNVYSIKRSSDFLSPMIVLESGILTTENIILDGKRVNANGSLIEARTATLNLNAGTRVQNNYHYGSYSKDWKLSGALGGGVYMYGGNVNIHGATITNNKVSYASDIEHSQGGGLAIYYGGLHISSGEISFNENVQYAGGAVHAGPVNITIEGGSITNNKGSVGGGISFFSYDGEASMTMTGGTIANNTATEGEGSGVRLTTNGSYSAIFYFKGGTIHNNVPAGSDICKIGNAQVIDQR